MTPARHNIVHVAKALGLKVDIECFANGTLARWNEGTTPFAVMFPNNAGLDDVSAAFASRRPKRVVRPENRPSQASLAKLAALCSGTDGVYAELEAPPSPIIHELSLTKAIELVLHPDGRVTWQRMGSDE